MGTEITSIALAFLTPDTTAVAGTASKAITEYEGQAPMTYYPPDDFGRAEILATASLLRSLHSLPLAMKDGTANSEAQVNAYLNEMSTHLEHAVNMGVPQLIPYPPKSDQFEAILAAAAALQGLTPVFAEAILGVVAWLRRARPDSIQYLASALTKAYANAMNHEIELVEVDESQTLIVETESIHRDVGWTYKGKRPKPGSPARLAQDIELAWYYARGERVKPSEVYRRWLGLANARS